jgi:Kef-type K+ transport system membrane component KefB
MESLPLLVALVGLVIILAIVLKVGLQKIGIPALVGYLGLGLGLSLIDQRWHLLSTMGRNVFAFMADIGLICLLFRVGIESKLSKLVAQLRRASLIWIGNVFISGLSGLGVAYYLLGLALVPSLFVAIALTATSIGIAVTVWKEKDALDSPHGQLLLDVAEMDDISAVLLMAFLFALVPSLQSGDGLPALGTMGRIVLPFMLKAGVFGAFCYSFSIWIEPKTTQFFQRLEPPPDFTLTVIGIGFIIAALAGLLGFSEAIGAFFAGLVFSRDPAAVKILTSFDTLYDLFVPFFFIGISLDLELSYLSAGLQLGGSLLLVAVLGKLIGTGLPALFLLDRRGAALLSISMVPRAEISMVVMQHGFDMGPEVVPAAVFSSMILVTVATSFGIPIILRSLLQQWPQTE